MKGQAMLKIVISLLLLNSATVMTKKKSQIIILGGGGGGPSHPIPYMHGGHSSPQLIPFPIPIFLPMQQPVQQPMMPPIQYLPSAPTPSYHPATQHIYHHHQNSSPQVHLIQLPIYKKEKYVQPTEYITTNSHHYQASEQYPIYSDDYSGSPGMHRRNGLEFRSFVPVHHFLNNQDRLEHLRIQRELKLQKLKKQKMLKKHRAEQRTNKKKRQNFAQSKNDTEDASNHSNHLSSQKNIKYDSLDKYDRFLKQGKVLYSDSLDRDLGLQADRNAMVRK